MEGRNNPLEGFDLDSFDGSQFANPFIEERDDDDFVEDPKPADPAATDEPEPEPEPNKGIQFREEDEDADSDEPEEDDFNFIEALAQEGIIDLSDEDKDVEKDLEWFSNKAKEKLQKDVDSAIAEYKDTLPETIKDLLNNYEEGVSLDKLLTIEKSIFEVSKINIDDLEENETLQKKVITNFLKSQGESDEDIRETLNDYEDAGLLKKQALRVHPKLVQAETAKKEQLVQAEKQKAVEQKEQYNKWLVDIKSTIDAKKEIIPGIELTDKQKKDLYAGITKVDKNGENEIVKFRKQNPDFDLQVAYIATVLKGDFSKFETIATTKATRTLKEKADALSTGGGKSASKLKGVDLEIMKKAINFK
jgi:hypothetical protein